MRVIFCLFFLLAALPASPGFALVAADPASVFGRDFIAHRVVEGQVPVPDITFYGADGAAHAIKDYRGKFVVLNFWATWCAPCVEEMPRLAKLQELRGGDRFAVVAISLDIKPDVKRLEGFLKRHKADGLPLFIDRDGEIQSTIPTNGLPTTMVIGPDGSMLHIFEGGADWAGPQALDFIDSLTGQKPDKVNGN